MAQEELFYTKNQAQALLENTSDAGNDVIGFWKKELSARTRK